MRMHPRLQSLFTHLDLQYWIPFLEGEWGKLVEDYELFMKIGKHSLRELLEEARDTLGGDLKEKLPDHKIDQLIAALYPKEKKPATASAAKVAPPSSSSSSSVATATPLLPTTAPAAAPAAPPEPLPSGPLCQRYTWAQTKYEVTVTLHGLPMDIKGKDIKLGARVANRLELHVRGEEVVDAELYALVDQNENDFEIFDGSKKGNPGRTLVVTLAKANTLTDEKWFSLLKPEPAPVE